MFVNLVLETLGHSDMITSMYTTKYEGRSSGVNGMGGLRGYEWERKSLWKA